eukprot:10295515-Ditylum_brightwellii.AAC.1
MLMEDNLKSTSPEEDLSEEDLEAVEGTNLSSNAPNKSMTSNTDEMNGDNQNITVIQMVTDLQQNTKTPVANPYSSSNKPRREGRNQDQNQNRDYLDIRFENEDEMILYQKYRKYIIAKRANIAAEAF